MELIFIILYFIIAYFSLLVVRSFIKQQKFIQIINKLPGEKSYPIVGTTLNAFLMPKEELFAYAVNRSKKFSPIYRSWVGPYPIVHLIRPEHVELMLGNSRNINKSTSYSFLHPWLGQGLLTSTGKKWFTHRKMITPTFHFIILEQFVEIFNTKSEIMVDKLSKRCTENKDSFNISPFVTRCALDIICHSAMGANLDVQNNPNSEYVTAVYDISEIIITRIIRPWLRPNFIFGLTKYGKRHDECLRTLHNFTDNIIQDRKLLTNQQNGSSDKTPEDEFGKKKRSAFLDLLLEASKSSSEPLTDEEIREEVNTFMFEGHDTTAAAISWAIFMLGRHPECQDKVYYELEGIFGDNPDRKISMRDLNEMKYLERAIKETLRHFPSVPFISRCLEEDINLEGYLIPKGSSITMEIIMVHKCKDQWKNPDQFNPDNFLPENMAKRHAYSYIPFSAGPRNCIGQKFALLEEKCILAYIFRKFRVEVAEKLEDMTIMSELVLRPKSGIIVNLHPR